MLACGARLDCEEFVKGENAGFAAFPAYEILLVILLQFGNSTVRTYPSAPRGRRVGRGGRRTPRSRSRTSCRSPCERTSSPYLFLPMALSEWWEGQKRAGYRVGCPGFILMLGIFWKAATAMS